MIKVHAVYSSNGYTFFEYSGFNEILVVLVQPTRTRTVRFEGKNYPIEWVK